MNNTRSREVNALFFWKNGDGLCNFFINEILSILNGVRLICKLIAIQAIKLFGSKASDLSVNVSVDLILSVGLMIFGRGAARTEAVPPNARSLFYATV